MKIGKEVSCFDEELGNYATKQKKFDIHSIELLLEDRLLHDNLIMILYDI